MKDEIVSGLRNAMSHGSSLEQAVASFVNAGYNPQEVQEAAKGISSGVSQIVQGGSETKHELPPMPKKEGSGGNAVAGGLPGGQKAAPTPVAPVGSGPKKPGTSKTFLVIALIMVLLAVLGGIGWLMYSFLKG